MYQDRFSERAVRAIELAQQAAVEMSHSYVDRSICCWACCRRIPAWRPGRCRRWASPSRWSGIKLKN